MINWYDVSSPPAFAFTASSGTPVSLSHPQADQIDPVDIAHHLSCINRFNGATIYPYSVAEHSLHVAMFVPPQFRLQALLHDAHEAYVGDITKPVKRFMNSAWYADVCIKLDRAIAARFGIEFPISCDEIHAADATVCKMEIASLVRVPGEKYKPEGLLFPYRPWHEIKVEFLNELIANSREHI